MKRQTRPGSTTQNACNNSTLNSKRYGFIFFLRINGGNGQKNEVLGDSDKNGVVEKGGAPITKSGKGYYLIKLNDKSMKYSVVAQ